MEDTAKQNVNNQIPQPIKNIIDSAAELGWEVGFEASKDSDIVEGIIIGSPDFIRKVQVTMEINKQ